MSERRLSLLVDADAAAEFAAGSFDLVTTRLTLSPAIPSGLWQRLRQSFQPRQTFGAWLYATLHAALSDHANSAPVDLGESELRAPAHKTPPDVPADETQLVLVRSRDETWAGMQLGGDAFKFNRRTLSAIALIIEDRRYQLRLTLSDPSTQVTCPIPVVEQDGTALALLETVMQLASFYRVRFEYVGP